MIVSVSRVKNSADIIEAFIRYNANIVDQFLIADASSSDNTRKILESLKEEGYPIEIFSNSELAFKQGENNSWLLQHAYHHYHPAYVLPLDDDEFIVPVTGTTLASAKQSILNLPKDRLYYLQYQTYYPDAHDSLNELDPVKRLVHYYPSPYALAKKTLIPATLIDSTTYFTEGAHDMHGLKINASSVATEIELAHYPCRSFEQVLSKILIGRWAFLLYPGAQESGGIHYTRLYNQLKNDFRTYTTILDDLVRQYISPYAPSLVREHELIGNQLSLKYTSPNEFNPFRNMAEYVESIIAQLLAK